MCVFLIEIAPLFFAANTPATAGRCVGLFTPLWSLLKKKLHHSCARYPATRTRVHEYKVKKKKKVVDVDS